MAAIHFDSPAVKPYHYALMSSGLPEFLDLARITRQPLEQAGRICIGTMPRLAALVSNKRSEATLQLRAQDQGSGRIVLQGTVQAELELICQRCLQPLQQHVDASFCLAWVRNEAEAATLQATACEPLLSADGRVKLADLVEDELLLALPIVALHEQQACATDVENDPGHVPAPETPAKQNPFAVLEQLKQHR